MQRNIVDNGVEDMVILHRFTLYDSSGENAKSPMNSSPYNKLLSDRVSESFVTVPTVTLEMILDDCEEETVDLLKSDCEGAYIVLS